MLIPECPSIVHNNSTMLQNAIGAVQKDLFSKITLLGSIVKNILKLDKT